MQPTIFAKATEAIEAFGVALIGKVASTSGNWQSWRAKSGHDKRKKGVEKTYAIETSPAMTVVKPYVIAFILAKLLITIVAPCTALETWPFTLRSLRYAASTELGRVMVRAPFDADLIGCPGLFLNEMIGSPGLFLNQIIGCTGLFLSQSIGGRWDFCFGLLALKPFFM